MSQELEVIERRDRDIAPLTANEITQQVMRVQEVMRAVMTEGQHYGVIPGTDKPTLLKPGAEKLAMTFRLAPSFVVTRTDLGNGHREYEVRCQLTHIPTGQVVGEGVGCCSTMESKYRYRRAQRTCPQCETGAVSKSQYAKGAKEYWYCRDCKAQYDQTDPAIVDQQVGRIDNPDIADQFNTVLKMAKKRAQIDATLTATAASDCFTQDLDEMRENEVAAKPLKTAPAPAPEPPAQRSKPQPPTNTADVITEGQLKMVIIAQQDAGVRDTEFKVYLKERHKIISRKQIRQQDLNAVLDWLQHQHNDRMDREEQEQESDRIAIVGESGLPIGMENY